MCLLRAGPASFFILLILIYCYMLTSHNCFKHFICYGMLPFLDGAFLVGPPPQIHFEKSVCLGFHGYKPQARKPCIAEHSREYFSRAPSRRGEYHSLINILSEFFLCHSRTAVLQPNFSGLKVAASSGSRSKYVYIYG